MKAEIISVTELAEKFWSRPIAEREIVTMLCDESSLPLDQMIDTAQRLLA